MKPSAGTKDLRDIIRYFLGQSFAFCRISSCPSQRRGRVSSRFSRFPTEERKWRDAAMISKRENYRNLLVG